MKMKQFVWFLALALLVNIVVGRAVSKKKEEQQVEEHPEPSVQEDALEYERYLKEVVNALETDPEFRKKLDNATDVDIRSGKIANELEHVNHHVRSKLDEIKRREIERLRLAAIKHKKLIHKTSEDLAEADRKRREDFKEYEMQKEFEKQEKLRAMDEEHKKQYEEELKRQTQKHNKHERIHHPGNKAQLEEVWEKQDHMEAADFDPKTFFMMHDLDGNDFWDETEVKALFVKELDKVYQSGLPEDDMRERVEEMERMREHVFREADTNHDNLISLDEFIAQTKREEFNRDPNWDTVDNQPQFTHEEYLEFERHRQEEIQRLIAQGALPPHANMPQGYYPNQQQQQYQYQGNYPQQVQMHPNQVHPGQINQGQVYPNQAYPNAQIQQPIGQVNQGQMHPGQINRGQVQPGQMNANQINTQYQQGNAQYQPPSNIGNQNINNPNINVKPAGQTGNQQQFQQAGNQNLNAIPVAAAQNSANLAQNQANVQYQQQPKIPESNLNQINANAKVETKN
ncbi:nucleobindin-2 isoform X2 [Sitodiplosis mosellana]|uniref:nucleobindin-2 isoform X2 n=1 Tax=Sitodiplosis mosellana TaxID=263140 RepID=UPI0024438AE5|nr:nucleobindin-2 isoform X2 [Sitodiplosis mosellana]